MKKKSNTFKVKIRNTRWTFFPNFCYKIISTIKKKILMIPKLSIDAGVVSPMISIEYEARSPTS